MTTGEARRPGLLIPEPAWRPGDHADFSGEALPGPGETRRPEIDEAPEEMRDLATGLVRVLDDECRAIGPWDPGLEPATLISGLRHMLLVRELDRRMLIAQRQGKASFYMQALGEEAVACGFRAAQGAGDMNFPTYRQQGLLIAADYPIELMMAQVYSNELDPLHGRQMPVMYSAREYGFFSISGNLATQYVQAVGWAMAAAIKGDDAVAGAWIGDGATAESDFHSAMVFASTYSPPVVLNIVNNQWAISTYQAVARGQARDVRDARARLRAPVAASRRQRLPRGRAPRPRGPSSGRVSGTVPAVVEWVTNRAGAHSSSDDPSGYRPEDEASAWPLGDPIERLRAHLVGAGVWSDDEHATLVREVEEQVRVAQTEAESHGTLQGGPAPSPKDIFEGVYREMPPHLRRQRQQAGY